MESTIVYIAGPLSNEDPEKVALNIENATIMAKNLWAKGFSVICPHMNSGSFYGLEVATETHFVNGYLEMIKRLDPEKDCICMLKGWETSSGAMKEFTLASKIGLTMMFEDEQPNSTWPHCRCAMAYKL